MPELSQKTSVAIQENELSVYAGELTPNCIIHNVVKIKKSFPTLPEGFYEIFADRIKENGFTDARLNDAVNNVIDNCIYPTPTIGQFISFDKRIKIYKYHDVIKMIEDGDLKAFDRYKKINLPGLPESVYIHINDIAKYKILIK